MVTHLRLFPAPETSDDLEETGHPMVGVRLGDLLPLMAMAEKQHFIWLKDYLDDEVRISGELHDILQAFRSWKPSA